MVTIAKLYSGVYIILVTFMIRWTGLRVINVGLNPGFYFVILALLHSPSGRLEVRWESTATKDKPSDYVGRPKNWPYIFVGTTASSRAKLLTPLERLQCSEHSTVTVDEAYDKSIKKS